jgi:CubicO group peptidase (beta-lactamase class C family)
VTELAPSRRRTVARFVREVARRDGLPGVSVAVVDADATLYADGFGSRDLESNAPATADTLYGVGSTTKSVTALAVFQLAERGDLALDDAVSDYLDVELPDDVTLGDLMSHASGLPSNGMANVLLGRLTDVGASPVPLSDWDDFYAHVEGAADDRIGGDPEPFFYYASGFTLLGKVIEAVTGRTYAEYVGERILGPLDMARATFDYEEFSADDDRMTPYVRGPDPRPAPFPAHELLYATGGLLVSVAELANYVRFHLNDGTFDGRTVLSSEWCKELHTPQVSTEGEMGMDAYGYGLMHQSFRNGTLIGHGGDAVVSTGYMGLHPTSGLGVVVGCNCSPGYGLGLLAQGILAAAAGADPLDSVGFFRDRRRAARHTGTYRSYRGIKTVRVEREGTRLELLVEGIAAGSEQRIPLIYDATEGDRTRYEAVLSTGRTATVTFVDREDATELVYERWRLYREDGQSDD